jgi:cell division protease FtsH
MIDDKVIEIVRSQHYKAAAILLENREKLQEISEYLYEKETITGEEFMQILNA